MLQVIFFGGRHVALLRQQACRSPASERKIQRHSAGFPCTSEGLAPTDLIAKR
jgi:hypothetical protein